MMLLSGVRVLIAEDEPLLALELQDTLADFQCEVVGTAAQLDSALNLGRELAFDIAVLDINLGDKRIDAVAEAIDARGLPIVFVSGYGAKGVPQHIRRGTILDKPVSAANLQTALIEALGLEE